MNSPANFGSALQGTLIGDYRFVALFAKKSLKAIFGVLQHYPPKNGHRQLDRPCPKSADIVAKVPKGAAANFPPKKETSDDRRSMGLQTRHQNRLCVERLATWSPTSSFNRCIYGAENLSPTSRKKAFATISARGGLQKHFNDSCNR
jgi:hypothetical protein